MGVQDQGLAQLSVDVEPLLPLSGVPLAAGTQFNSRGIRTLSYTVGGLEEGCLQAQSQRASEVTRNLGSVPATALLSLYVSSSLSLSSLSITTWLLKLQDSRPDAIMPRDRREHLSL